MIEKRRLEELIKQGATIYCPYYMYYDGVELDNQDYVDDEFLYIFRQVWKKESSYDKFPFKCLFETREDAEWYREFGSIERTERLELPTWEEVSRDLENAPVGNYVIKSSDGWSLEYVKYNETVIGLYSEYVWSEWEATKENYSLACRKAKELFLGEKK